jgi:ubiquinone/menaquinone biosynthesis C-methylase UbiE
MRLMDNLHRYSAPNATLYDAVTAPLLRRFFRRVAGDIAELAPQGRVLEVGAGPGRLAATLAKLAPDVRVAGVDIAPTWWSAPASWQPDPAWPTELPWGR